MEDGARASRAEKLLERLLDQGRLAGVRSAALLCLDGQASAAMLIDGEPYPARLERLPLDCALGERGTIERLCGDAALERALREDLAGTQRRLGGCVYDDAALYSPLAQKRVDDYARTLALALMSLIHLFDPERILLAGRAAQLGALLADPIRAFLREHCFFDEYAAVELIGGVGESDRNA